MAQIIHIIEETENGWPVKNVVLGTLKVSNTRYSRMKFNGGVSLDGANAFANDKVRAGQELVLTEMEAPGYQVAAYERYVPMMYEDEHLYVVDKPAPMASQTGTRKFSDTLENAMFQYFGRPADFIFRPVNRLDKGTSGLMVVAKSGYVHALMQKQLHTDTFVRTYLAVTDGVPEPKMGIIEKPIGRVEGSTIKRMIRADGKVAITEYRVEKNCGARALVWLRLTTGRTHQIRVHMESLGCPVAGDYIYGRELAEIQGRFALHSAFLSFIHPITGETIQAEAPLPEALNHLLLK